MQQLLTDLAFANEVVIVDSFSTDKTKEISESFANVRFIENPFENYTKQRNFAIDQAKNNWLLFLDADERLTQELKQEIIDTVNQEETCSAYLFYRTFFFKNKVLHFSGLQTDKIFRLFKKDKARYTYKRLVHEKLDVEGKIGTLKNKLIHYSYADFESYKQKMAAYGKLKAKEKYLIGFNPSIVHTFGHPIYNFLYNFIIRLGFLDGKKGVIICYLNAYSVYARYEELKKLRAENN
jgi:glycosyltransferase involved in cell wall biosynthesis